MASDFSNKKDSRTQVQKTPQEAITQSGVSLREGTEVASTRRPATTNPSGTEELPEHVRWIQAGAQFNQYELIRELGRGGMGMVWLARDQRLGRRVAIKFLILPDPRLHDRFLVEARATAQCQHDNIVVIHEVNQIHNTPYMVLEFLEGQPLGDAMEGSTFTPPQAVETMVPVARALVRAAEERMVHRDLKPDNIFVTRAGTVKVLDFGIAKIFLEGTEQDAAPQSISVTSIKEVYETLSTGGMVGTLPYMSPEQWGKAPVDQRTDVWACGVILFEMVTGRHPVEPLTANGLAQMAASSEPLPSVRNVRQDIPDALAALIDRCLAKNPDQRIGSAQELLDGLLSLAPSQRAFSLTQGENPFPGLTAFQEKDAARFFGRDSDVQRAIVGLENTPLLAVVGASGVGKSSFVRAGLLPALKARGQEWESLVVRPGRTPFESLAGMLVPLLGSGTPTNQSHESLLKEQRHLGKRLREEPGFLGAALRARARQRGANYLLFVDQFEELYTLVDNEEERLAFTRCLSGVADDISTPLRVVLSMRADLLDRVAEDAQFQSEVTRGLVLLAPPTEAGLRDALVQPPSLSGYQFEDPKIVDEMLDFLRGSAGSLPLLQFAASRLWEEKDESRQLLTRSAYEAMGGVSGALSRHADDVLLRMTPELKNLARGVFQRLVTPERTRAVVEVSELTPLHREPGEVLQLLQILAAARLLVLQSSKDEDGSGTVEIVHESLIEAWPMLRRWLDESEVDTAFLHQLQSAAKQWEAKGGDAGLLWRGEIVGEAERFMERYEGPLAVREEDFLEASIKYSTRSARLKKTLSVAAIFLLSLMLAGTTFGLVKIRAAEQDAVKQAERAQGEMVRAQQAEQESKRALERVKEEEQARVLAEETANKALKSDERSREELQLALAEAEKNEKEALEALQRAEQARGKQREAEKKSQDAEAKVNTLQEKERAKTDAAKGQIVTELD